jgi:lysophospholipase L1-like esterase
MVADPGPGAGASTTSGLAEAADVLRRHERGRRLWTGLKSAVLTLAALLALAEVALRVSGYRRHSFEASVNKTNRRWVELTRAGIFEECADTVRRYRMRPGSEAMVDSWTFRVSSHGTRGVDFPRQKPAGERRLVCLGDSFAFGLWCDEDETLVGHLARRANEREAELGSGTTWRGVDLGVPGYHAGQILRTLEQDGLGLAPDAVVYYFNSNDIEQEGYFYDQDLGCLRRDFLPLPVFLRRWLWTSHVYGWIATHYRRAVEDGPAPQFEARVRYAFVRADNQAATRAAIARMKELCDTRGIPFFLVDQPLLTYQGDYDPRRWRAGDPLSGAPIGELMAWSEGVRRELGIQGLSLFGLFRGWSDGVDRFEGLPPGAEPPPLDFLLDSFVADERFQAIVASARMHAAAEGADWDALPYADQVRHVAAVGTPGGWPPPEPDFHLTGAGYGAIARLVYPAMQAAGILP